MAQHSPYYYKELFIELVIRSANEGSCFYQVRITDSAIQDMVSLFPKLDGDEYGKSVPDMDGRAEVRWEEFENMDHNEMIKKVKSGLSHPATRTALEKLVDEELSIYGIDPKIALKTLASSANPLNQKIGMLVQRRVGLLNPKSALPRREDSFKCYVHILVGGWAEVSKKVVLYFTYTDTFAYFVSQLHDATQHCIIPPKNVALPSQLPNRNDPDSQDPIFRSRSSDETGYTLSDGPWIYRLAETVLRSGETTRRYKPGKPIAWEDQYNFMKDEIRESAEQLRVEGNTDWTAHVILMHSMDQLSHSTLKRQRDLDRKEEEAFQVRFKQVLGENANNPWVISNGVKDGGERYTDMMRRVHNKDREVWEMRGLEGALLACQDVSSK